jgi:DNA replication protein DnaC
MPRYLLHHAGCPLANELQEAESRKELARVVGRYARTELVVLDELGYLALPDGAGELVFQVLSERHERGSLIVTTNLPFGEWTKDSGRFRHDLPAKKS